MIGSNEKLVRKTIAFDGTVGKGAQGTINLFTVTGSVYVLVVAWCTENLAGATATIETGTSSLTTGLIALTTATDIDAGEVWFDATPAGIEPQTSIGGAFIAGGDDIIATIRTADITDGTLTWGCFWTPLSTDGNVVAA